jgi:hypothetical protein
MNDFARLYPRHACHGVGKSRIYISNVRVSKSRGAIHRERFQVIMYDEVN